MYQSNNHNTLKEDKAFWRYVMMEQCTSLVNTRSKEYSETLKTLNNTETHIRLVRDLLITKNSETCL